MLPNQTRTKRKRVMIETRKMGHLRLRAPLANCTRVPYPYVTETCLVTAGQRDEPTWHVSALSRVALTHGHRRRVMY